MKFNIENSKLVVSVNKKDLTDQLVTIAFALFFIVGMFWYAPEQMGWS